VVRSLECQIMLNLTFVAGKHWAAWRDVESWTEADVNEKGSRFRSGVDTWIVQTYLFVRDALKSEGWRVSLEPDFVPGSIAVAHWDELHRFGLRAPLAYLIGVRADRPPLLVADTIVRQNGVEPESPTSVNMPMWPQPGIIARDASRGDTLERVGYFGRRALAPAFFHQSSFISELNALGLAFAASEHDWQDYHNVDVVLAFRDEPPAMLAQKPAAKLTNAWLAGVPAIVGYEPAYLELRTDELDFGIARDAAGVIAELRKLKAHPTVYRAMRERASARAVEFGQDAVRAIWLRFFRDRVAPAFTQWQATPALHSTRYPWYLRNLAAQHAYAKRFRAQLRAEQADRSLTLDAHTKRGARATLPA
jgi:hypothetical protein